MRANKKIILLSAIGATLSGCGGLSSLTGTGATPSNSVRQNQTGDTFTYSVGGTYSQTNGVQNAATSGSTTETFVADTYAGQAALDDKATTVIALNGGTTTLIDEKQLSSANLVLAQSDNNTLQVVSANPLTLPLTLSQGSTGSGTETLANGTTVAVQYTVTGSANITAAGTSYACWTISRTVTFSDGLSSAQTIEFAPSIGAAVTETIQNTYTGGLTELLALQLSTAPTLG